MIMAAIGNALSDYGPQRYVTRGAIEQAIRPILRLEELTTGRL